VPDGAQQRLTALSVHLGLASRAVDQAPASAGPALHAAQVELEGAIEELRDLVHGIHPPVLRRLGLARAIEVAAARASTPIELVALPVGRLDEVAETSAYFVVLEALNNAQRYAGAQLIRVRVELRGDRLRAEVADDGVGGATEQDELGLQGLRDRVEAIGGTFHIHSEPGVGTRIVAAIPAQPIDRRAAAPPDGH
jgi:signal transduction histidine kinase